MSYVDDQGSAAGVEVLAARGVMELDPVTFADFGETPIENAVEDGAMEKAKLAHDATI